MLTQNQKQNDEDGNDRLYLTFSAEEVGKIAVSILRGIERKEAVHAMLRYTKEQYKVYAAFYDQLKEAIDWAWKEK
jgi:hypothetical protein